jgi:hypothetical protein
MSNDPSRPPTRRDAMKGLGAGLAAAPLALAADKAQAQGPAPQGQGGARREGLRDPRNAYPKPPSRYSSSPGRAWPGT